MSLRGNTIKVMEVICDDLPPLAFNDGEREVVVCEDSFVRKGISLDEAFYILKDEIGFDYFNHLEPVTVEGRFTGIKLLVSPNMQHYLKRLKYPESEYEDFVDYNNAVTPVSTSKTNIVIDSNKGIYLENNIDKTYPLKKTSKRMEMISILCSKDNVRLGEFEKRTDRASTVVMQEIRKINSVFRSKLNCAYDLIVRVPTGGYSLNKDHLNIKTLL